jgi:preprotein translocase subunit SecA
MVVPRQTQPASIDTGPDGPPTEVPGRLWRALASETAPTARRLQGLDALWNVAVGRITHAVPRRRRLLRRADAVLERAAALRRGSEARLRETAESLRARFRLGREEPDDVVEAFALVREVAARRLGLRPYPEQIAAAFGLLEGCVVELATGEGKTLAATLPAVVAGWRGRGCHIITANDYLAARDAREMGEVYSGCGVSVAHVESTMSPVERRRAYRAGVTYCTNKEVAADFLRDRLARGRQRGLAALLLRRFAEGRGTGVEQLLVPGLATAIVDEADSILIDEAVTPLIISGGEPTADQIEAFTQAAGVVDAFGELVDYHVDRRFREVRLTDAGRAHLERLAPTLGAYWSSRRRREELVTQALSARELFNAGEHYVLDDGKVVIVDEFTGRLMPDRTWRAGLHQAVQAKEGLEVTAVLDTLARISFQRFFRLYRHLAGMTGTAWAARHELWETYRLPTVTLPTHRPCVREQHADRVYADAETRWCAVVESVEAVHETGRPVLVGTRSVEASEGLSRRLQERQLEHQVLNAVRHAEEAAVVAQAGRRGHITVATNMAGRGTDIKLERGVAELGGLHVIATERHESGRIDRQLFGRAGRQGDPGSAAAIVSLEDDLLRRGGPTVRAAAARLRSRADDGDVPSRLASPLIAIAQTRAERLARRQRSAVARSDDWLDRYLGFAGRE